MSEFFPYWVLNTFDRNFLLRYYGETFDYGYPAQFDDLDEARVESEETSGGEGSSEPVAKKPKKWKWENEIPESQYVIWIFMSEEEKTQEI